MFQTTIKECFMITGGVGLHSGKPTRLVFYPAKAGEGIVFHRLDKDTKIPAIYQYAKVSPLCTTIEKDGVGVQTIEHLLSVCCGMGLDNLLVEIENEEMPIFDGSGVEFFEQFSKVGFAELDQPRQGIKIIKPVRFQKGGIEILISPAEDTSYTFAIDFEHQQVGQQEFQFNFSEKNYQDQIVRAKTFCMEQDVEALLDQGLIKGGNTSNAIVLGKDGHFNNLEVMTWLNEPNLHKILDQIGDFYLAGNLRIIGAVYSSKSGHASHLEFLRYLLEERPDAWEKVDL